MRVLIADDDPVSRRMLEHSLSQWGYAVIASEDGTAAIDHLTKDNAPHLLVLDWMMPGLSGPEVCKQVRKRDDGNDFYILLLTARVEQSDIVEGLESGADDFVTKPFDRDELRCRVAVGKRIIELQTRLADRVHELEEALAEVRELRGLLPICSYCKRIREGADYWQSVEGYLAHHTDATFSHGVCPECYDRHVKPQIADL